MERREFFKLAGAGAGALIVAPQFVLSEPKPKEPIITIPDPQPPPGQYEMGYIYRDNTQIAAVANCCVEMHQLLDHAAIDYNGWKVWHTSGPIETTISGDLFPLENENESSTYEAAQFSLKMGDETLRIILAFPQGDMKIDAEGYITSTTIESSMDSPLVHSFTFQVMGEIQMLYT